MIWEFYNNILNDYLILEFFIKKLNFIITFINNLITFTESNSYYMKDFDYFQNLKKNENFQIIINNYILKDYFIFNNLNTANSLSLFNEQQWYLIIQTFFSNLEIFLIVIQKLAYDYIDYIKSLFIWYNNYKILIYKNIVNSNLIEELYYNISLDLLLDVQKESNKSLIWLLQNNMHNLNLKQQLLIKIFDNFNIILKEKPYKVNINLLYLYKTYPRINMLSYGLTYDLNIFTNKYYENIINKNIWNNVLETDLLINKKIDNIMINKKIKHLYTDFNTFNYISNQKNFKEANSIFYNTHLEFLSENVRTPKSNRLLNEKLKWNEIFSRTQPYILDAYNWYLFIKNKIPTDYIMSYFPFLYENIFIKKFFLKQAYLNVERTFGLDFDLIEKEYFLTKKMEEKNIMKNRTNTLINYILQNPFRDIQLPMHHFSNETIDNNLINYVINNVTNKTNNKINKLIDNIIDNKYYLLHENETIKNSIENFFKNLVKFQNPKQSNYLNNISNENINAFGGYTNYWTKIQNLEEEGLYYRKPEIVQAYGYKKEFILLPKKWISLNLQQFRKAINLKPYLSILKVPKHITLAQRTNIGNITSTQDLVQFYSKINNIVDEDDLINENLLNEEESKMIFDLKKKEEEKQKWFSEIIKKKKNETNEKKLLNDSEFREWFFSRLDKYKYKKLLENFDEKMFDKIIYSTITHKNEIAIQDLKKQAILEIVRKNDKNLLEEENKFLEEKLTKIIENKLLQEKWEASQPRNLKEFVIGQIDQIGKKVNFENLKDFLIGQNVNFQKKKEWFKSSGTSNIILNFFRNNKSYEFRMWEWPTFRPGYYDIHYKGQAKWGIYIKNIDDISHIKKPEHVKILNMVINFVNEQYSLTSSDIDPDDYPEDFFTIITQHKNFFQEMKLYGYKSMLKNRNSVKYLLLSDDLYPKIASKGTNMKENFYKKSILLNDFRNLKENNIFSIKNKEDLFHYVKFSYNKPDILWNKLYPMHQIRTNLYNDESSKWYIPKNYLKNFLNIKLNKSYVRQIKPNNNYFAIGSTEKLYDFVTYLNNISDYYSFKFSKKNQYEIRNLLLENKIILETSKKIYKMSLKELQANWLEKNILDTFLNKKYLTTQYYLKKNNLITWNMFYTQIESVVEPINLNIINKNFYGNYIDSDELNGNLLNNYKVKNNILPRNTHILLKKNYIIQLLNLYEKEEQSIKNFLLYKIKKQEFKIIYKYFTNIYHILYDNIIYIWNISKKTIPYFFNFLIEELIHRLLENKQIKLIIKYYKLLNININIQSYYKYLIIIIYIFIYCIITSILIILIKSFIPKNLIYGVKLREKKKIKQILWNLITLKKKKINKQTKWESILEGLKFTEDVKKEDLEEDLENFININFKKFKNKQLTEKEQIKIKNSLYIDILKQIEKIDDLNIENIKKIELEKKKLELEEKYKKLGAKTRFLNFNLKNNFFDAETKYIYSWESRFDKNLIEKGIKNIKKIQVYNKFEEKKKQDLKKNYIIFYKKFLFEKNLEKWENNTKFRLENPLDWYIMINSIFFKLKKLLESFRRDKKYNHNRIVFWEDPSLDEWTKTTYVYILPKPFFTFFFIIKFIIGSIKLWNISYWIQKWKQYVIYGIRTKISYKELRDRLEKEWTLEWYKDNSDYGSGMYLKNMMKIAKTYNNIKKFPSNKEIYEKTQKREEILQNIITLIQEDDKLKEISEFLNNLDKIKLERIENNFDNKFIDINKKLVLDVEEIDPKKWIEQEVRYDYIDLVFEKKLQVEKEEYKLLKQSYTKRTYRDSDDKEKTLQFIEDIDEKKIKTIMEKKIATLEYEKKLRQHNFEKKIIDEALDLKEKVYFESIKEYNEALSEAYLEFEKNEKSKKTAEQLTEKKIKTLYGIYEQYYPYYRKWTTMGARMNYVLAQIIMIFSGWVDNFKRIRKNEYNVENIFKIIWIDLLDYIYKMYWEYMIIFKEYESLKKWGLNIKTILKFSLILTPILIYSVILYIIFILFFWWYFIYIKTKNIIFNIIKKIFKSLNILLNNKISKIIIKTKLFIKQIFYYMNYILNIFNLLLKNIDTGNTILEELYLKFYNICAWIQRNIYFIKGAFILKYNENKNIKEGLYSVKEYLGLKYNSYIELKKQKKNYYFQTFFIKKKENIKVKIELLMILLNVEFIFKTNKVKILRKLHTYIIYPIFKFSWKDFYYLYKKNFELYEKYKKILKENLNIILLLKNIKIWDLIKLITKNIIKLIILPFSYIIKHQQNKYVNNYKQGIQGFRNNPMYLILDNPKKKKTWKTKLHDILMKRKISKYLQNLLETQSHIIEIFFMFKIFEVKWTKKNYYQDFFWRKWYWYFKGYKKRILNWLIEYITIIEESYQNFEEGIETQNWSLWERCKYAYYTYKMYNHVMTRGSQREISRNIFFYKKAKERDKLIRIYFIKGIINWISYITINKIIFTNIKDLKSKKIKSKNLKYYIKNIKGTIHLSSYIEEMPPQFWALIIIYNKYYRYLLKYLYNDPSYPKKWQENQDLEYKKDYKWRLSSPNHNYDIPFYDRRFIATDMNSLQFKDFISSLANQPYDPLIRWVLFLLEYGLTTESLIDEGNKIFIENSKQEVWGDISLTHLLTYNKNIDEYNYEIKEFNRLIEGIDFLKVAENTLERDKVKDYFNKFKNVKERIISKNEDILQNILKKRRLTKAKMLHKALLRNKLKTPEELQEEKDEENKKEYFFVKKKEFFEDMLIEKYWNWQEQYESEIIEDKYFNSNDLWNATYKAHNAEDFFFNQGKLVDHHYLIDHIVLLSFDETLEEIYSFLMFKIWKILEKDLKKNHKNKIINYKHLAIDPNILSRLNYTEYLELKTIEVLDKKTKQNYLKNIYEYKYNKIIWEPLRIHHSYSYVENNLLAMYYEVGDVFTYEDKIQFNIEAVNYERKDKFHEQEILSKLLNIILERKKKLKNIKRNQINKNEIKNDFDFGFINNIKWTWEQWLLYQNIEKENDILNKNIIIFNERYNIWNLKRVPIRLKLPVMLEIEQDYDYYIKEILDDSDQFLSNGFTLMSSTITPILKQSLEWEQCKLTLEKHFNKNIQDIIFWIFSTDLLNKEMLKIKKDYEFVLKNFIQNYSNFQKLYFLGLPHYSWDLIRYYEIWLGQEEFAFDKYFQLKQIEFLNHDPAAKRMIEKLHNMFIDKYNPISFIFFFKYQFVNNYLSPLCNIMIFSNIIWLLKILYYNPGEFIGNNFLFYAPILFIWGGFILRKKFKKLNDLNNGLEIYLYKYRSSNIMSLAEWQKVKLNLDRTKRAWIEHFYDKDKIQEVFGSAGADALSAKRDPDWWRFHTFLNKTNDLTKSKHTTFLLTIMFWYFLSDYWGQYKHRYRNSRWLWEYYKIRQEEYDFYVKNKIFIAKSFSERIWLEDTWTRLENGNSLFCKWYEDYYRKLRHLPVRDLDYANVLDAKNIDFQMYYKGWEEKKHLLHYSTGFSDGNWVYLSRFLEALVRSEKLQIYDTFTKSSIKFHEDLLRCFVTSKAWRHSEKKEWTRAQVRALDKFEHKIFRKTYDWYDTYQNGFSFYYKNISKLHEELLYSKNYLNDFYFFKKDIKDKLAQMKEDLYVWKLGKLYDVYNPAHKSQQWPQFIQWVKDEMDNYDIKDISHLYSNFLTKLQENIYPLIWKDIKRYTSKQDAYIFGSYYDEIFKKKKDMYIAHKECFETGKALDIKALLEISETAKHYHNFSYHLVKYKLERVIILKKTNPRVLLRQYEAPVKWFSKNAEEAQRLFKEVGEHYKHILQEQYFGSWLYAGRNRILYSRLKINDFLIWFNAHAKKIWYDSPTISRIPPLDYLKYSLDLEKAKTLKYLNILGDKLYHHQQVIKFYNIDKMLVKFLRKKGRYIKNINIEISKPEIVEYKTKLLTNFLKEKTNFWIFIENFSIKLDIMELFMILVKLILKILG